MNSNPVKFYLEAWKILLLKLYTKKLGKLKL